MQKCHVDGFRKTTHTSGRVAKKEGNHVLPLKDANRHNLEVLDAHAIAWTEPVVSRALDRVKDR